MEGKNLWAKFGFVFVLLAVSVCAIMVYGLKRGPDIAGGYSMTFEVENPKNDSRMVEDIISILKQRVDPTGLSSIEWRPLGSSRFEVRMPEASDKSKKYRADFNKQEEALLATNIERTDISAIMNLPANQRDAKINALVENDKPRAEAVKALVIATENLNAAEAARAQAQAQAKVETSSTSKRKELQAALSAANDAQEKAIDDYRKKLDKVRQGNISSRDIFSLFRAYDKAMAQNVEDKRQAAMVIFTDRADMLREDHPSQEKRINALIEFYKEWSEIKSPLEDPNDLKRMIQKSGVLEFRIAPFSPTASRYAQYSPFTQKQVEEYTRILVDKGPEATIANGDYVWMPLRDEGEKYNEEVVADAGGTRYMLLSNRSGETMLQDRKGKKEWQLDSANPTNDQLGKPAVSFGFDARGAQLFGILTSAHKENSSTGKPGMPMAILLDNEVYSAPTIQATITSSGQITGNFSIEEVKELARILKAGSLPGKVKPEPISESAFSAALGKINIEKGIQSAIYGMMAVAVFMFLYYLLAGAVADVALMMNIVLVLGAMSLLQAAMTLPGIAGIILTIGMAVDANVLIYERLREEQNRGLGVRQALKNAYERAFSAIFDSNITTLLICAFLYFVFGELGMGEVRGFAITLGLGVMFSMFTALVVTRWVFQLLMDTSILSKPIKMLALVPIAKINWISKRYYFWIISAALIVIGMISLSWQGGNIWGIEFSSGTQVLLILKDDAMLDNKLPQDEIVRSAFGGKAAAMLSGANDQLKLKIGKLSGSATRVEAKLADNKVADFVSKYGNEKGEVTLANWKNKHKNVAFFEALDKDRNGVLTMAELQNLPQRTYQISTTCADVPLIHKVLNEAFGDAVERRVPCTYQIVNGKAVPKLGIKVADAGATVITPELIQQLSASVRDDMMDFEGGVMIVIDDVKPAITVADLTGRINDIRSQPDFEKQAGNPTKVIGLAGDDEDLTSFAVVVRPADIELMSKPIFREQFTEAERSVLTNALEREDPTIITSFDASIAKDTASYAIVAVILSWLTIIVYLWVRFGSAQWGLAAVLCLVHDVLIVVGMVAVSGWLAGTAIGNLLGVGVFKIDLTMVAAILTIIGYSVNDTIVVFDRIRENRGKLKVVTAECINDSINQTLPRTLLTSFTTFLVVLVMYIFGGEGMRSFNYALLIGIVVGTYSSIAIASPLLLGFKYALVAKTDEGENAEQPQDDELALPQE